MYVHPEMRDAFTFQKKYLAHNHPGWTFEAVEEAAQAKLFAEAQVDTQLLCNRLGISLCPKAPATVDRPVEWYEEHLTAEPETYFEDDEEEA